LERHPRDAQELSQLRAMLEERTAAQSLELFGQVGGPRTASVVDYYWDESLQSPRIEILDRHGVMPGKHRVLDLAAGCGQFVMRALREGFDCEGVEPDPWRINFVEQKIRLSGDPPSWTQRFHCAFGEKLPFADDTFDYVTSYQTLEHVRDPGQVLAEMVRVTRKGGALHVRCPDYRGIFEAHYRIPWLPLFPRPLARAYLRLLGRPLKGLDTLQYVTRPRLLSWISSIERGRRFMVVDENRLAFDNALRRRRAPRIPGAYWVWRGLPIARAIGRDVLGIDMFIRILGK
jgi:SAM-dependent methyltransferase